VTSPSRTSGSARTRAGRPRDVAIDAAIDDAAIAVLVEHGIAGFSLGEVARRVGVPKSTVYRRWGTQQDLLVHALEQFERAQPPIPDTGSMRGDLVALVEQRFLEFGTQAHVTIERLGAEAGEDPAVLEPVRRIGVQRHDAGRVAFRRGIERGEVRADLDVELAVEFLAGSVWTHIFSRRPTDRADAEAIVDRLLLGFGVRA
jgi:AcrR family transcriptional regulator